MDGGEQGVVLGPHADQPQPQQRRDAYGQPWPWRDEQWQQPQPPRNNPSPFWNRH